MELSAALDPCWRRQRTWEGTTTDRATAVIREARLDRASHRAQVIQGASIGSRAITAGPAAMVLQEVTAVGEAAAVLTTLQGSRATVILMVAAVALSTRTQPPTTVPTLGQARPTTRRTQAATLTPARATNPPANRAARITPAVRPQRARGLPVSSAGSRGARQPEMEKLETVTTPHRLPAVLALMGELVRAPAQVCQVLACRQTQLCRVLQRCRSTQQVGRWFLGCPLESPESCPLNT